MSSWIKAVVGIAFCLALPLHVLRVLTVPPKRLSHIPAVPVWPLILSYAAREPEDKRIQSVILPFANKGKHQVVLVWTFGFWIVHVVDVELGKATLIKRSLIRDLPSSDMLMARFVGFNNIAFSNGDMWKRHSRAIMSAFQLPVPFNAFDTVMQRAVEVIKSAASAKHSNASNGSVELMWDDYSQRITLDVLGSSILGHSFNVVQDPESQFAQGYRGMMKDMMAPPYIFFPILDRIFPRKELIKKVEAMREEFRRLILNKLENPTNDLISRLVQDPSFSNADVLDNVAVMFVAGHDTTAGALSSIVYYLARYSMHQRLARQDVLQHMHTSDSPTLEIISKMSYLFACIRESMRLNNPSNMTLPRVSQEAIDIGTTRIPPKTLVVMNICALHRVDAAWNGCESNPEFASEASELAPEEFNPIRFLGADEQKSTEKVAFFGLGLRQCPARNFAMMQLRAVVAILLREFEWNLPNHSPHRKRIENGFSFATNLNIPHELGIVFTSLDK